MLDQTARNLSDSLVLIHRIRKNADSKPQRLSAAKRERIHDVCRTLLDGCRVAHQKYEDGCREVELHASVAADHQTDTHTSAPGNSSNTSRFVVSKPRSHIDILQSASETNTGAIDPSSSVHQSLGKRTYDAVTLVGCGACKPEKNSRDPSQSSNPLSQKPAPGLYSEAHNAEITLRDTATVVARSAIGHPTNIVDLGCGSSDEDSEPEESKKRAGEHEVEVILQKKFKVFTDA